MPETSIGSNTKKATNETGSQSHTKEASAHAKESLSHAKESTSQAKQSLDHAQESISAAASSAKDSLSGAAGTVATRIEKTVSQVEEQGQQLLHDAGQKAGRIYNEASDIAQHAAVEVRTQARAAGRYAKTAGKNSVSFVGMHALPLAALGLSLGWLALSMRSQSRPRVTYAQPRQTPALRGAYREPVVTDYRETYREQDAAYREPLTSDGSASIKVLGVRTIESNR